MKTSLRRAVFRRLATATFAAVATLGAWVPAQASTDVLDQAQTLTIGMQRQIPWLAQTFTAGANGQLDRVSLAYDTMGFTNIRVSLRPVTSTGAPGGTTLGSQVAWSGTVVCCRGFHDFTLNPAITVSSGTKYALVVQTISGVFTWYSDATIDAYTRGQLYVGATWLTGSQWGDDFAFKTWVVGSANQAPAVAADSAAVTVNEGTAATNTGTYSDPDGDAVTLSASTGTLTRTGTSSGTWAWTQPAADEGPAQNVTVTAGDAQGSTATATFAVTVGALTPVAQIVNDPPSIPEGSAEPFTGSATSADAADNAAGFAYAWLVTKNGNSYATGSGSSFAFTPDDEGTYVVTFRATDDGGMSGTDSVTVIGTNVPPTASITNVSASVPFVIAPSESLTFTGAFTDPGTLDTHSAIWDFGDGSSASGFTATHAYASAGTYRVTLTVTDDDGGVGRATTSVTVQTTQQALAAIAGAVQRLSSLNSGQKKSLIAKLDAAAASSARGDTNAANNQLDAFLNELRADANTGKLSSADAAALSSAVHAVKGALGTYNRFLEWWPLAL